MGEINQLSRRLQLATDSIPLLKFDGNPVLPGERETSLSWWLEEVQRRTYPNLSRFTINILSIPAMSAEPECVFSGCRRTIMWQRMRLGVKAVKEGECLKSWIRSGVVAGIRYNELNSKVMRTWRLAMASYLTKTKLSNEPYHYLISLT
jgi:hAT family C-terminal dimerisation region